MSDIASPVASATDAQRKASDPQVSAWVSANAGSGKTHVLVNRVVRLMLAGCPPDRILCLTFTKAAASEMANRLFRMLGQWTTLPDEELVEKITALGDARPNERTLLAARRLFANALETPGGLKIQTIHAFCESLLQRFPLEAGVAPGFDVLDTRSAEEMLGQIREALLSAGSMEPDGEIGHALDVAVRHLSEYTFDLVMRELLDKRSAFRAAIPGADYVDGAVAGLRDGFGLSADETPATIIREIAHLDDNQRSRYAGTREALGTGGKTDATAAQAISDLLNAADDEQRFDHLKAVFLTREGKPRARLITKKPAEAYPGAAEWLENEQQRLVDGLERHRSAVVVEISAALMVIADRVIADYARAKRLRAALDYDDLIERTVTLFDRSEAAWVLYKLDGGLDHILVDEAQDTSPEQWSVIRNLAEEFFSGEGARNETRTVFAVGDEKQSIYSFQGARPAEFDAMKRFFSRRAENARRRFETVPLIVSFRSVPGVLDAVDRVFANPDAARGLGYDGSAVVHEAVRRGEAGLIEIWPTVTPEDREEDTDPWLTPLDRVGQMNPRVRLAEKMADLVAGWVNSGTEMLEARGRAVRAGDILILVRRRDAFADAMVRALKRRGVPVAGADRLVLTGHIAVLDLIALIRFLLLPVDDLTLATVLKSPLVTRGDGGWIDDEDLFRLAHGRKASLLEALNAATDDPVFAPALQTLTQWRELARRAAPFEFLNIILGRDRARARFIARLGTEANDPIDEFVALALQYERENTPSLQGFLHWVSEAETEIKRDMDHGRDEVRIMTVHGAKGLEANVVFMPDTCAVPGVHHDPNILFVDPEGADTGDRLFPVWAGRKANDTEAMTAARTHLHDERREEYHRLLYVAMTRARDRLYVCGYEGRNGRGEGCWYDLVASALSGAAETVTGADGEDVLRLLSGQQQAVTQPEEPVEAAADWQAAPQWALAPAPAEPPVLRPIAPSRLEAIEADGTPVYGDDQPAVSPLGIGDADRFRRGRLIHRLLQILPDFPPVRRSDSAEQYLIENAADMASGDRQAIAAEVMAILDDDRFAALFAAGSRAEVPLVATLPLPGPDGRPLVISGQVDRLIVNDARVMIVDYKTNRPPPALVEDVAPLYVRQMAAYRLALAAIFPNRPVQCVLVWTDEPRIMELPEDMLDAAFGVDRI